MRRDAVGPAWNVVEPKAAGFVGDDLQFNSPRAWLGWAERHKRAWNRRAPLVNRSSSDLSSSGLRLCADGHQHKSDRDSAPHRHASRFYALKTIYHPATESPR
jgi:hypothetical protein